MEISGADLLGDDDVSKDVGRSSDAAGRDDFVCSDPTFEDLFVFDHRFDEGVEVGEVNGGLFVGGGASWVKSPFCCQRVMKEKTLFGFLHEVRQVESGLRFVMCPGDLRKRSGSID